MGGPLEGVKVLEFSEMIAAPFAGMHLGDLGADIIKVEPCDGEPWRLTSPFAPTESRAFLALNRNKRGLAIDLKSTAGQAVIHRLVPSMDVVLVNYRPDTPAKLGIDYETLRTINPGIVYAENTFLGRRGPDAHRPGYDLAAQAYTGLLVTTGRQDEEGLPLPLTPAIADFATGLTMAYAVCAALFARQRTGVGQKVESTLLATSLALQGAAFMRAEAFSPSDDTAVTYGVPAAPVRRIADLPDDPQVLANDLCVELHHPVAGTMSMVGPLVHMSATPASIRSAPPTLGQHNNEILAELGYDRTEIATLRQEGVIR